jgi:hypothetical protein
MIGYSIGSDEVKTMKETAVDLGFAKWVPDKNGYTTFHWNVKP